jgi:hypothetical protein
MLFSNRDTSDFLKRLHLAKWFLRFGAIGVVVAILLDIFNDSIPTVLLLPLWPAALVLLVDPRTIGSEILVGIAAFGSNFLLYGLVGVVIGIISGERGRSGG